MQLTSFIDKAVAEGRKVFYAIPGKQQMFLDSVADDVFYGGAFGGGKSYGLVLCVLKGLISVPGYRAIIFRRVIADFKQGGGLIDECEAIFPLYGATYNIADRLWTFPNGATLKFAGMLDDRQATSIDGGQFDFIGADELPHLEEYMKEQMIMRIRSVRDTKGIFRSTGNPKKRSWLLKDLMWFLDKDGFPIEERCGKLRWWMRGEGDEKIWFNSREDCEDYWRFSNPKEFQDALDGKRTMFIPQSFTFINSKATDNTVMASKDESYQGKLDNAPKAVRKAKRDGCWFFDEDEGMYFNPKDVGDPLDLVLVDDVWYFRGKGGAPGDKYGAIKRSVRGMDFAYAPVSETNKNPDWTVSTRMDYLDNGMTLVADHQFIQGNALAVEALIQKCIDNDPKGTEISIPKDPAGGYGFATLLLRKFVVEQKVNMVATTEVAAPRNSDLTAKEYRFLPFSRATQAGMISLRRDDEWNDRWFGYLSALGSEDSKGVKRDDCDSTSRAFNHLDGKLQAQTFSASDYL